MLTSGRSLFNHDSFDLAIKCGSSNWFPVHKLLVRRNRVLAGAIERLADVGARLSLSHLILMTLTLCADSEPT